MALHSMHTVLAPLSLAVVLMPGVGATDSQPVSVVALGRTTHESASSNRLRRIRVLECGG